MNQKILKFDIELGYKIVLCALVVFISLCMKSSKHSEPTDTECSDNDRYKLNWTIANSVIDTTLSKEFYDSLLYKRDNCLSVYSCISLIKNRFLDLEKSNTCKCYTARLNEDIKLMYGFKDDYACDQFTPDEDFYSIRDSIRLMFERDQAVRTPVGETDGKDISRIDSINYSFIQRKISIEYLSNNRLSTDDAQKLLIVLLHNTIISNEQDVEIYSNLIRGLELGLFSFTDVRMVLSRHKFAVEGPGFLTTEGDENIYSGIEHLRKYVDKLYKGI